MSTSGPAAPPIHPDVPALVEELFARAFDERGLAERLAATGVVLAIDLDDLERTLILDLPFRRVDADGAGAADARIGIRSADLNRYLQDDLNLTLAIAEGDVRVSGAIVRVLTALGTEVGALSRLYRTILTSAGRTDLLR